MIFESLESKNITSFGFHNILILYKVIFILHIGYDSVDV